MEKLNKITGLQALAIFSAMEKAKEQNFIGAYTFISDTGEVYTIQTTKHPSEFLNLIKQTKKHE